MPEHSNVAAAIPSEPRTAYSAPCLQVDPADEEAKGGSGAVGKMLLSSGDKQLALLCYVPDDKLEKVNASEWMKATLASCKGEFVSGDGKVAVGVSVGDGKEKFPLKVRPASLHQEEDGTDSARWLTNRLRSPAPAGAALPKRYCGSATTKARRR